MKKILGKRAIVLARRHMPDIYQGVEHLVDIPCPMEFGEFRQDLRASLYYAARTDEKYYYIIYAAYHYLDYTKCPAAQLLDILGIANTQHRHDFEGILLRVPYYVPHGKRKEADAVITVAHHELIYYNVWPEGPIEITIQSRGHAIEPIQYADQDFRDLKNPMLLNDVELISLDSFSKGAWEYIKAEFNKNGVNMPDQWSHKNSFEGWFWNKPGALFNTMETL